MKLDIKKLVDRFLQWPLPKSVRSDVCVTTPNYPSRIGTNLMTADEAEQMFNYLLGDYINEERRLKVISDKLKNMAYNSSQATEDIQFLLSIVNRE